MLASEIILVEDNENDEELAVRALKKANIKNEITVLRDGAEALDYFFCRGAYSHLKDNIIKPRVLLLDLNLPKVSGLEVLKQLRSSEITAFLPIVILTSSKEDRDVLEGYKLGANSYVVKPVDFDQFAKAVQELGLYWTLHNQSPQNINHT